MHKSFLSALGAVAFATATVSFNLIAQAAPITGGNLVVIRVGDGATTPTGAGLPVTLDEYSVTYTAGVPTGVALQQSIPLPSATSGSAPTSGNRYLTQGGTAGGEGGLTLSSDGKFMALAGYNNIVGAATNGTGNNGQRVVGLLNLSTGAVDTTTDYADAPTASAVRNAYTTNGTDIWTANSAAGVRYVTAGGSTSTALTVTSNERRVYVYNSQLYTSRQSAPVDGVATVGTGTPTSGASQTVTLLSGMPIVNANESAYDYFFADAKTLYVADDGSANAGLQKWTLSGTTWSMAWDHVIAAINPGGSAAVKGIKSLTGYVDASGNAILFASTVGTGTNNLLGLIDPVGNTTAAGVTENVLTSATTAYNFRGVALAPLVPEPTTLALAIPGALLIFRRRRA